MHFWIFFLAVIPRLSEKITKAKRKARQNEEKTQKEIAKSMGISRSYVSRIEKRAITKILREFIKKDTR